MASQQLGSPASPPSASPWVELCVLTGFEKWSMYRDLTMYILRISKAFRITSPILTVSKISRNENVILLEQCLDHGDGAGWGVLT